MALLAGATPVLALSESSGDETAATVERNRHLLEKWRGEPEHYARLLHDVHAFHALPPEQQARMRRLDHDLHEEESEAQARLWRVLERFANWLERLPEGDRLNILETTDSKERLRRIKEIREREWVERQPLAIREELAKAPADQRASQIARFKREERQRRQEWAGPARVKPGPVPKRLADFPPEVQRFVNEALMPMLNDEEKQQLKDADARGNGVARMLAVLADRHPIELPGPSTGPTRFPELPTDVRKALAPKMLDGMRLTESARRKLAPYQGKWPEFAIAVTEFARTNNITLPQQLGPSSPHDKRFSHIVQDFIEKTLVPALVGKEEKDHLKSAEGRWPEYPRTILELARKHELMVPGMYLPGPREAWHNLKTATPDLPKPMLREFAALELKRADLERLRAEITDGVSWERVLTQEYFKRHPSANDQAAERQKNPKKPKKVPADETK